jgi:hypothetical protein
LNDSSTYSLVPVHAAVNQGGKGGGQTNNQAAQAIVQGKNPGEINQGQACEGVIRISSIRIFVSIRF